MLTKTEQKKLLQLCKDVLIARRNGKLKREQAAIDKLRAWCEPRQIDPNDAMEQAIKWLKAHSIAASMNGLV